MLVLLLVLCAAVYCCARNTLLLIAAVNVTGFVLLWSAKAHRQQQYEYRRIYVYSNKYRAGSLLAFCSCCVN